MNKIVDKNRLLDLLDDIRVNETAFRILSYLYPDDKEILKKILHYLVSLEIHNETSLFNFIIISRYVLSFKPSIDDLPTIFKLMGKALTIPIESINPELEDRFELKEIAGPFLNLIFKIEYNDLREYLEIVDDNDIKKFISQIIETTHDDKKISTSESVQGLLSLTERLTDLYIEEENEDKDEDMEKQIEIEQNRSLEIDELESLLNIYKRIILLEKDNYYELITNSVKESVKTENMALQELAVEIVGIWRVVELIPQLVEMMGEIDVDYTIYDTVIFALSNMQSDKISPYADEAFKFKMESSIAFAEILGEHPYTWSEDLLIKYMYKEKDSYKATFIAMGLSDMFSLKGAKAIKDLADKNKLTDEVSTLKELLLPIYIYHKLEIPDWLNVEEDDDIEDEDDL